MSYAEKESIESGLLFKTQSGLLVKTTGRSVHVHSVDVNVHEVEIVEGPGKGNTFLCNLDYAQPVQG